MTESKVHKYDYKKKICLEMPLILYIQSLEGSLEKVMSETNNFPGPENKNETDTFIFGLVRSRPRPRL